MGRNAEGNFANGAIIGSASASAPPVIGEMLERATPDAPRPTRAEMRRARHISGTRTGIPAQ